jgi:hypothetical protein
MKCEFQNSCRELCANQPLLEMQALDWGQLEDQADGEDSGYILITEGHIRCAGYILDEPTPNSDTQMHYLCQVIGDPPQIKTTLDPLLAGISTAEAIVLVSPLPNVPRHFNRPPAEKSL